MLYLGIDFGTSGARACVITADGKLVAEQRLAHPTVADNDLPASWRATLFQLILAFPRDIRARIAAIAIDGTSSTVVLCDRALQPVLAPLWYHDCRAGLQAQQLARLAGSSHVTASASSSLAKMLWFATQPGHERARYLLHQADWLAAQLNGVACSDYHNALKLGYDPADCIYPDWLLALSQSGWLPRVQAPGSDIAPLIPAVAEQLGLPAGCMVRAGTTDSMAAFMATGVNEPGGGVTSLGSTLVLKLVSPVRIDQAEHGIYSHRYGPYWLVGGASNSGGAVLAHYFSAAEIEQLSQQIDPQEDSQLDYYPLPKAGERFPCNDPHLAPRLLPVPENRAEFLHGILQGIARIEATGYALLQRHGAPKLKYVVSTGGGSRNAVFSSMRQRILGVPVSRSVYEEAAYGSALLAAQKTLGDRHDN